ncbi:hypothetical protein FQA39_LY09124 [Lamprigera yunnana]|nr:hypothetical protein FQA39_LY09124 [Lamprigera yunnana]
MRVCETQMFNITVTNVNTSTAELVFYNQYEDLVRTDPQRITLQPGIETYKINVTGLGAGHSTLTTLATENVNNVNTSTAELVFYNQYEDLVRTDPQRITLQPGIETYKINVTGLGAGHSTLTTLATENVNVDDAYMIVKIYKSNVLDVISIIIGWMYFATWSVSFYPQIITNFRRKRTEFDYLALNVVGYVFIYYLHIGWILCTSCYKLVFYNQYEDLVRTDPQRITLQPGIETYKINVTGLGAGHSTLTTLATENVNVDDAYMIVKIYKSNVLDVISIIIGWMYFATWSVSFYPQIITNFRRKSVIGLNFDYLALNVVGYVSYTIFTLGVYYVPVVIDEYLERHPRGLIPVTVSDNAFNIHGLLAILFTISQCVVYERGSQRISVVASIILGLFGLLYGVGIALAISSYIHWLDFLYFCSYIKLLITLFKYVPQALLNYRRKSTDGWSIGGVFLDLAGGLFSILQMILDAYNYERTEQVDNNNGHINDNCKDLKEQSKEIVDDVEEKTKIAKKMIMNYKEGEYSNFQEPQRGFMKNYWGIKNESVMKSELYGTKFNHSLRCGKDGVRKMEANTIIIIIIMNRENTAIVVKEEIIIIILRDLIKGIKLIIITKIEIVDHVEEI